MKIIFRVIRKFRSLLSKHQKKRVIELSMLMVISGLLETFSVSLMLPFMSAAMNPNDLIEKWYVKYICGLLGIESTRIFMVLFAVILALIYIIKNAYLLIEYNIQYKFVYRNMFSVQRQLLERVINKPYEYFLDLNSADIIRLINSDVINTFSLLLTVLSFITESIVSLMLIFTIFIITPVETILIASILLGMVFLINMIIKPRLYKAGIDSQTAYSGMNKWLLQSVHGIKELKVMGTEDFFREKFSENGEVYIKSLRISQILTLAPRFIIEASSVGAVFLVVAFLIYNGKEIKSIIPMLTAIALAAVRLLPSMNRISGALASISYAEPMLDKVLSYWDSNEFIERYHDRSVAKDIYRTGKIVFNDKIVVSNVNYRYKGSNIDVLDDAVLEIKKGKSVGIVGASGAGKTTLVDVVLGLLIPTKGCVMVDGYDIFTDIRQWHTLIGYIPQSIFLLDATIRDNVAFGIPKEDVSDEKIWRALQEACLEEFVEKLPKKLDTEIGERGVKLSGGQRQRIGIARALYSEPSVLILDEATSALDNDTEASIMESINNLHGRKTIIIIAHRLTTIERCDEVYCVSDGHIQKRDG